MPSPIQTALALSLSALLPAVASAANVIPPSHPTTIAVDASSASSVADSSLPADRIHDAEVDYAAWLNQIEQRNATAGLATAIVVGNSTVFERTLGYADASTREPISADTVFRLASLSKAFSSALTAKLIQSGSFSWSTPLASVIPDFRLKTPEATQAVTIADILGQRVGLPKNTYDNLIEEEIPFDQVVQQLDQVDLVCPVGQCYGYQNVTYSLIGEVVQNKTGQSLPDEVKQQLFRPLGMLTASYGLNALESSTSWARPHHGSTQGWVPFRPLEAYYHVAPAAGVNASLHDMEKWLAAQMGERPDVLNAAALSTVHTPGVSTALELRSTPWRQARLSTANYALGWRVFTYAGETLVFHAGAVDGYRTMIGFFPKYHVGVVTLWNSTSYIPSGLMPMVFDRLLGLNHVDWADIEHDTPIRRVLAHAAAPAPTRASKHHGRVALASSHTAARQARSHKAAPHGPLASQTKAHKKAAASAHHSNSD